MSLPGRGPQSGDDRPVRVPIHPGLRALLFSANWIRGAERFTKTLRVHMISVTDTTEYIDVLEWSVDPVVEHHYHKPFNTQAYKEEQAFKRWAEKLLRKYFRRCNEIGRLRKQVKALQKYNERIETLKHEHKAEMEAMQENLTLLQRMYNSLAEQTGAKIDVQAWGEAVSTDGETVWKGPTAPDAGLGTTACCGARRGGFICTHIPGESAYRNIRD